MSYPSRSKRSNYGNQRKTSNQRGFGKKSKNANSFDNGSYSAKELHEKYAKSGGCNLFEAIDSGNDYWTVVFKPDGHWLGRYSKSDAIARAARKNAAFNTASPYVGLEIGTYNSSGDLVRKNKIIAVDMNPDGFIPGTVVALLDDGTQVTRDIPYFDKKLAEKR